MYSRISCSDGSAISARSAVADINMPGVDGFEVLTRLKNEGGADASIIMTSGRNDLETVMRCVDLGADSYLLKPVDPLLFVQRVLASLQRRYTKQWKRDRSATQLA